MKKIIFIFRDGFDAEYICNKISVLKEQYEIVFILESGKKARKKKISRMIKSGPNIFQVFLNMCALVLYDKIMLKAMSRICKKENDFRQIRTYYVDDVNDAECISLCNQISPDLIVIYGTAILSSDTIKSMKVDIYNVHSSILPYYRNVHSDFWAYMNEEYDKIGITIFKVNAGIDTGSIAKQMRCNLPINSKLYEYKVENLKNIVKLVPLFLDDYFHDKIMLQEQKRDSGSSSYTPKTKDLIRLLKIENR